MLSKFFKTPEVPAVLILAILTLAGVGGSLILADDDDDRHVIRNKNVVVVGNEDRAYMGVQLEEEVDLEEGGARVTDVVEDSPADEADLREGDVIVAFEERTIHGPGTLTKMLHAREPGDEVTLQVIRDGRRMAVTIELGSRSQVWSGLPGGGFAWSTGDGQGHSWIQPEILELQELEGLGELEGLEGLESLEGLRGFSVSPNFNFSFGSRARLGVQLVETTPELREHLGGSEDAGVIVSKVLDGTPADQAGVQVGDLILSINGDEVKNSRELRNALHDKAGETFDVELVRDGQRRQIEVTIPEPDDESPSGPRALRFSAPEGRAALRTALREVRIAQRVNAQQVREAVQAATRAASRSTRNVQREVGRAARDAARRALAQRKTLL